MKEVLDFAKGKMTYEKFVEVLEEKPEAWAFLQGLVPGDIADANCEYRKKYALDRNFETNGYNIEDALTVFSYDDLYTKIGICKEIPNLVELNIGHSIISRAIFVGLEQAVKEMKALCEGK